MEVSPEATVFNSLPLSDMLPPMEVRPATNSKIDSPLGEVGAITVHMCLQGTVLYLIHDSQTQE